MLRKKNSHFYLIIRSIKLLLLGMFVVNGSASWQSFRVPGVLQRFFISYLFVGVMHVMLKQDKNDRFHAVLIDILPYWKEWALITVLVVIYHCLTYPFCCITLVTEKRMMLKESSLLSPYL